MRWLALAVLPLAFAACTKAEAPAPAPEPKEAEPLPETPAAEANKALESCGPATAEKWCGVTFGATSPDEAMRVFPAPIERYTSDDVAKDPNLCFEMFVKEPIQGVSFLAENNKVGRLDVSSVGPVTADGFGVGTKAEDIRGKYGPALKEQRNKYEPDVTDLTVDAPPGRFLYEIQDGSVRAWRAGVPPLVDYVERCG